MMDINTRIGLGIGIILAVFIILLIYELWKDIL